MRNFGIFIGLLMAALTCALCAAFFQSEKSDIANPVKPEDVEAYDLMKATELFDTGNYEESLMIVQDHKNEIEQLSENGLRWLELFIKGSEATKDVPQLIALFEFFPEVFKEKEEASLLIADSYITNNQLKSYKKVRSLWEDREMQVAAWFILDIDQLLLEGKRDEAIEKLNSRTFKNKADIARLVRLGLLFSEEDPKLAWQYLTEAYSKDPQNADVRSYRAQLLESVGKYNRAHKEYQAATQLNPNDIFLKDQLADFYIRQRQYPSAMAILEENLAAPSLDSLWIKALFWGKVATPMHFAWEKHPLPRGHLDPFLTYMARLPKDIYWDEKAFSAVPQHSNYLQTQQATYWLKLIEALKSKNEVEAYTMLQFNPFIASSWHPELETALKQVLSYRLNGTLKFDDPINRLKPASEGHFELPPFFQQLEELAYSDHPLPESLQRLLSSNEVFSAVFIEAGWNEAGLQLHQLPVIPDLFPQWVCYNLAQAIHKNRSTIEALEFVLVQSPTPEMSLLAAEFMVIGGDLETALKKLQQITKLDTDIGFKASWLASQIYTEKQDWENAKTAIISQPRLVNDTLGKEALARIAYLEGDKKLASKLYAGIKNSSAEARSFLAKKAYSEKNWNKARELTENLIADYPENPVLKKNLETIVEEQKKAQERSITTNAS